MDQSDATTVDTTPIRGRTILVTGGAGFVGSHLADALVGDNEVRVVDDLTNGRPENVPEGATFIEGTFATTTCSRGRWTGSTSSSTRRGSSASRRRLRIPQRVRIGTRPPRSPCWSAHARRTHASSSRRASPSTATPTLRAPGQRGGPEAAGLPVRRRQRI